MFRSSNGFTLLELMVTLVIIAIFAVIAIPSYQYFIAKTKKSQTQAEMLKLSERLENYRGKQLTYAGFIPDNQNIGAGQKGIVNIPYGSSNTEYDYQIKVVDINYDYAASDTSQSNPLAQPLEDATIGQGWKIIAVPNQNKSTALRRSESLLLNSQGLKCMTADLLTVLSNNCSNSRDW